MYAHPKLESLGVRVRWTPWGRAFVWQADLDNSVGFRTRVDRRSFEAAYGRMNGKSWIPWFEWAGVLEGALSMKGVSK